MILQMETLSQIWRRKKRRMLMMTVKTAVCHSLIPRMKRKKKFQQRKKVKHGKSWKRKHERWIKREDNSDSYKRRMKAFNWWVPERDTSSSRHSSKSLVYSDDEYKGEDSDQDSEVEKAKPRKAGRDKESRKPEKCDKRKMNGFGSQVVDKKNPGRSFHKKPKLG